MESLLPKDCLEFLNTAPSPLLLYLLSEERTKALKSFFTGKQCCFIMSAITIAWLLDVIRILISVYSIWIVVFHLSRPSLAAIDFAKRRAALRGWEPWRSRISTPGFEMIKRVSYLLQEWEVRGWMMSEMQTHSHLNTAWDGENERQRGTWMREEASHHGVGWNRVEDRRQRAWGKCLWEEKKDDYLRNFCETKALAPSTCLDIVLTTMPPPKAIMTRFMGCTCLVMYLDFKNLPAALFVRWYKALLAIQKRNHTETRRNGHNETPAQYASIQSNGLAVNALLCEVDIVQPLEVNQPFTCTAVDM